MDLVTALAVLLSGLAAGGLLCVDLYRRERGGPLALVDSPTEGRRFSLTCRNAGLALTVVFVVMVAWRFIGLAG
ncbi:MAG: hypothetical protein QOK15_1131 [Nocardioidaceae bacterium]|jgi:hypothetical protein|nr:hypothetical protein [Nocardioidaceae bacterium]